MELASFFKKIYDNRPIVSDPKISSILETWSHIPRQVSTTHQNSDQLIRLIHDFDLKNYHQFYGVSFLNKIEKTPSSIVFGMFIEMYLSINFLLDGQILIEDIEDEVLMVFAKDTDSFFEVLLLLNMLFKYKMEKTPFDAASFVEKVCEAAGSYDWYDILLGKLEEWN